MRREVRNNDLLALRLSEGKRVAVLSMKTPKTQRVKDRKNPQQEIGCFMETRLPLDIDLFSPQRSTWSQYQRPKIQLEVSFSIVCRLNQRNLVGPSTTIKCSSCSIVTKRR